MIAVTTSSERDDRSDAMKAIQPTSAPARYGSAVTVQTEQAAKARFPRWAIVLIASVGGVFVLIAVLVIALVVSLLSGPAWGPTAARELQPGSCLAEADTDLKTYTVVTCDAAHPQQVVAIIDLSRNTSQYSTPNALTTFANEICDRFIEYGLFVAESVDDSYDLVAVAVPSPEALAAGDSAARCSLVRADGTPLTSDLFREMP